MRYFTCKTRGCKRTFEGSTALHIHQARMHKNGQPTVTVNGNGNGRLNGNTPGLSTEARTIGVVTVLLDSLSTIGLGYVAIRATERLNQITTTGEKA